MSMQDSLTIGISVFIASITVVVIGVLRYVFMQSQFIADMTAFQNAASAVGFFDYIPLAFLLGSFISSMYFSSKIRAKPIFLPVSFLFLSVSVVVGYVLSLLPAEMAEYTVFGEVFSSFGITSIVMQNLHIIILVVGLIGMVSLYALQGGRGGGRRAPLR
jgi:hypothetical protein